MTAAHVEPHGGHHRHLEERMEVGHIDETGDVEREGAQVEREQVGVFHQRQRPTAEIVAQRMWNVLGVGIALAHPAVELLKGRRRLLLLAAVAGVVIVERALPEVTLLGQRVVDGTLGTAVVEFAASLAEEEEEVNLPVVVGVHALILMAYDAGDGTDDKREDAPVVVGEGDVHLPYSEHQAGVDGNEPRIASHTVEHTPHERTLVGEARQLTVGRVAEIGCHEQQNTDDVERELGKVEHHSCRSTENHRNDGDGVGTDAHLGADEGDDETGRTIEHGVEPLLGVVGFV